VSEVTGTKIRNNVTLPAYLKNEAATAVTPLLGQPGPIILVAGFFKLPYPAFTLVHEVLLHAYAGLPDHAVLTNPLFADKTVGKLWNDGKGSTTISGWLSTDCTCTPGDPAAPTCQPNTASWGIQK
jgi:hypothetical protein